MFDVIFVFLEFYINLINIELILYCYVLCINGLMLGVYFKVYFLNVLIFNCIFCENFCDMEIILFDLS